MKQFIAESPNGMAQVFTALFNLALGVSCDPSEAEIHWRAFLDSLIDRRMRGGRFVVSATTMPS